MQRCVLFICLFVVLAGSLQSQVPTNGLVAYFPFNGNAFDESGGGNNGSVYGATLTADRFGRSNSAYQFNDNLYIKGTCVQFPSGAKTISVWFKANQISGPMSVFGYGGNGSYGSCLFMDLNHTETPSSYHIEGHGNVNNFSSPYSSPPINNWYNWVVTSDVSGTKMYINGSQIYSNTTFINNTYSAGKDFIIGGCVGVNGVAPYVDGNTGYFRGVLDDIRVYSRALTSDEVLRLYQESITPVSLVQSINISDSVGSNKNLTFGIDPSATDGIDPLLGEEQLPPVPPAGVFDARFNIINNMSVHKDFRQGFFDFVGTKEHQIQVQPGIGNRYKISWVFPATITGRLQDVVTGALIDVQMAGTGNYTVTNAAAYNKLKLTITYNLKPSAPVLLSPADNAVNVLLSSKMSWSSVPNARRYRLQASVNSSFTNNAIDDTTITDTAYSNSSLTNNTKYYWRVLSINNAGQSTYTTARNFTTIPQPPNPPALLLPANNAMNQSINPSLSWQAVTGATGYWVQVSLDPGFVQFVLNDSVVTATSKQVIGLQPNQIYYWRAAAKNAVGWGSFSDTRNFKTLQSVPTIPVLISPLNNAQYVPSSIALNWQSSSGADRYVLQVSKDSLFNTLFISDTNVVVTTYILSQLSNSTKYFWRVKAVNTSGASVYSTVWRFTTRRGSQNLTSKLPLYVTDNSGNSKTLYFGLDPNATDGVDPDIEEEILPPLPPSGNFDARFNIAGNVSLWNDFRQGNADAVGYEYHEIQFQPGIGTSISISWNFPENVTARLNDLVTGQIIDVPMKDSGSYTVQNPGAINKLKMTVLYKLGIPLSPKLFLPLNNAVKLPVNQLFKWTSRIKATHYQLEIATDSLFNNLTFIDTLIADTSRQYNGLAYLTKYYWRVLAKNSLGSSNYSPVWNFTTIIERPAKPTLIQPANNVAGLVQPVTLQWNPAARTELYRVQIATDNAFTNIVFADSMLTTVQRVLPKLNDLMKYYWRVNARNEGGISDWSDTWNFKTLGAPVPVVLSVPGNLSVNNPISNLNLKWLKGQDGLKAISGYWLELSLDTLSNPLFRDTLLTDTTRQLNGLSYFTNYFWRVRAKNEAGWGAFSNWWKFRTIIEPPPPPVLAVPNNNSVGLINPITLKWRSTPRAEQYRLQVAADNNFTSIVFVDSVLTDTSRQLPPMNALTQYFWRVAARNIGGAGQWSDTWLFKTLGTPTQVLPLQPYNGAEDQPISLVLKWSKAQDRMKTIMNYWFELATDSLFTSVVRRDTSLTDTTTSQSGLSYYSNYFWRIKSRNEVGWSDFSVAFKFRTIIEKPPPPSLASPQNLSVGVLQPVALKWQKTLRAVSYILHITYDSTFNTTWTDSSLADTFKVINGLSNGTKYYWRIKAKNIGGIGDWSPVWNFKTLGTPVPVVLSYPLNNSTNVPLNNVVCRWLKGQDGLKTISGYLFELATDPLFANVILRDTAVTDTIRQLGTLNYSTEYFWRVKAKNEIGWGAFSSIWKFMTKIAPPGTVQLHSPVSGTVGLIQPVLLKWRIADRAEKYRLQVSADSNFSAIVFNDTTLTDTIKILPSLNHYAKYFWRVNAYNIGGTGAWSSVWSFKTLGAPYAVTLTTPANNSSSQPVNGLIFKWNKGKEQTENIQKYHFQLSLDSLFTMLIQNDTTVIDTTTTVSSLTGSVKYFWRVKAKNEVNWGDWSVVWNFTTGSNCRNVTMLKGWNIISIPFTSPDMQRTALFPTSNSLAYTYLNGYVTRDTLQNAKGYWLRFPDTITVPICGTLVVPKTIPVSAGWNLIGAFETGVPVGQLTTTPPGIINSLFYGYSNGYQNADTLKAGRGYWIRVSQSGIINTPTVVAKSTTEIPSVAYNFPASLIIRDMSGKESRLYFSDASVADKYELPPVPPSGIADIRFSNNKLVEDLHRGGLVSLQSCEYPLRIRASGIDLVVSDAVSYKVFRAYLKDGNETVLTNPAITSLKVFQSMLPAEISLLQNYPNPFNPETRLGFLLPNAQKVKLTIYNQLGQAIAVLKDEICEAGSHEVVWNAAAMPSGIYFYELLAGNFRQIKKTVLMK